MIKEKQEDYLIRMPMSVNNTGKKLKKKSKREG